MKNQADLVSGWIRKAESDLTNVQLCIDAGQALDTACFHAQQAAEKYLKAYLCAYRIEFPFIHNLEKLIELCEQQNPEFNGIKSVGQSLTPFAVELRYDTEFWPSIGDAQQAMEAATAIKLFIAEQLPTTTD